MAIEIRGNVQWEGIKEPVSGKEDKISLFADDSAGMLANPNKQLKEGRQSVGKYERTTDSRLHDKKTKILPLGRSKETLLPQKQLGVEFEILGEKDREKYLGDLLGHEVTEKERFKGGFENIEKIEKGWQREKVTFFGRAVIFNVLMIACIKYRADVNPISADLKEKMKTKAREFIWKHGRPYVKYETLIRTREEGGIGLKDPGCALDAAKIRILKNMRTKSEQPWVKWIKRKEKRLQEKWKVEGNVYGYTPTRKQKKEMNEKCVYEQTMKIWYEIDGTTQYDYENKLTNRKMKIEDRERHRREKNERNKRKEQMSREETEAKQRHRTHKKTRENIEQAMQECPEMVNPDVAKAFEKMLTEAMIEEIMSKEQVKQIKKEQKAIKEKEEEEQKRKEKMEEIGVEIGGGWIKVEVLQTKQVYEKLVSKRYGESKEADRKINHGTTTLYNTLHPNERQYWWRCAHKIIQTQNQKAKWLKDVNGKMTSNKCPMCETDKETWSHYEYECEVTQTYIDRLKEVYDEHTSDMEEREEWRRPTVVEWRLQKEEMSHEKMYVIAKARWMLHGARCLKMKKERKRVDVDVVIERLKEELKWTREQKEKKEEKKEEGGGEEEGSEEEEKEEEEEKREKEEGEGEKEDKKEKEKE
jgi:hypothetical protein